MKLNFEQRLFTEAETAAYMSVSRSYLRAARCYGNKPGKREAPPFVRLGRTIRYDKNMMDQWIDSHVVQNPGSIHHG